MINFDLISQDIDQIKSELQNISIQNFDLGDDLKKYFNSSAKLIRPCLCLLIQKAIFKESNEIVNKIALAIELAHNASLLHDDVIDDADTRRGIPSFNNLTNNKTAILVGDLLIAKILFILNKINNLRINNLFAQAIENMSIGEIYQFYKKYDMPTMDEYFDKNIKKTGELFKIACLAPLIINNEFQYEENMTNFAYHFANAFQIRDDIMNYFNLNSDKPTQTDEKQGIYTLPLILSKLNQTDNLYKECCKILTHQVNLSMECLSFLDDNEYKQNIVSLCKMMLLEEKFSENRY